MPGLDIFRSARGASADASYRLGATRRLSGHCRRSGMGPSRNALYGRDSGLMNFMIAPLRAGSIAERFAKSSETTHVWNKIVRPVPAGAAETARTRRLDVGQGRRQNQAILGPAWIKRSDLQLRLQQRLEGLSVGHQATTQGVSWLVIMLLPADRRLRQGVISRATLRHCRACVGDSFV